MTREVAFEIEHEIDATDETGEVVADYVTRTYRVSYDVEPAQRGGYTDPSWDAHAYLDGDILDEDGDIITDPVVVEAAKRAIDRAFESDLREARYERARSRRGSYW